MKFGATTHNLEPNRLEPQGKQGCADKLRNLI